MFEKAAVSRLFQTVLLSNYICPKSMCLVNLSDILETCKLICRITLEESHQVYSALTSERKDAIFRRIYKHMDDEFASFTAHIGYSNK